MNKIYVSPKAQVVTLQAESMLALSLKKIDTSADTQETIGGTSALSGERGWSSENWTSDED